MIEQNGAFITYGPEDFTPGHLEICSFQLGDPEDCPVCKTRPPFNQRRAKQLVLVAGAALAVSACAAPIVTTQPNSCSSLLPMDWRHGVAGAPLPDGNTVGDWIVFGDAQTGKLDQANGRTKDAIGIVERCEQRDAAAVKKATHRFLGIF